MGNNATQVRDAALPKNLTAVTLLKGQYLRQIHAQAEVQMDKNKGTALKMNEQNHQISIRRRETIFNNGCTVVMKG